MSLEVRLGQRQEQRLALLPQMLQSIEVLQLATAELLQKVEAELQQNETLEALPPAAVEPPPSPELRAAERDDDGWREWRRDPAGGDDDGKAGALPRRWHAIIFSPRSSTPKKVPNVAWPCTATFWPGSLDPVSLTWLFCSLLPAPLR